MAQKPSIPKGTRDFSPEEMAKRNYIFNTIREVYALYGFSPIETPAMETLQTLMGKYGEEGDKLLFKVLGRDDRKLTFYALFTAIRFRVKYHNRISPLFRYGLTFTKSEETVRANLVQDQ